MAAMWILPPADLGTSVPSLVLDAGMFAKFILLILFVISVVSWAVIWDRSRLYLRLARKGALARDSLKKKGLSLTLTSAKAFIPSVEGAILIEAKRLLERDYGRMEKTRAGSGNENSDIRSHLERRAIEEFSEMEKYLVFLATTSSVSPFLGLLGTVWGIMSSFLSMGVHGTASLGVVGPGIAEALVTTIAGLGAAIPALVGYNLLARYIRRQETRIDIFITRIVELMGKIDKSVSPEGKEGTYEKNPIQQHT